MSRRRLLSAKEWADVERRRALNRANCWKAIAADLGISTSSLKNAIHQYRVTQARKQRRGTA